MNSVNKILELMKKNNVNALQLSKELGFSTGLFSQWKKGLQNPSLKNLTKIAEYFNVPLAYFYEDESKKLPAEAESLSESQLLNRIYEKAERLDKLNDSQKALIMKIVDDFVQYFIEEHKQ